MTRDTPRSKKRVPYLLHHTTTTSQLYLITPATSPLAMANMRARPFHLLEHRHSNKAPPAIQQLRPDRLDKTTPILTPAEFTIVSEI